MLYTDCIGSLQIQLLHDHDQDGLPFKVWNVHMVFFGLLLPDRPTKISHTEVPGDRPRSLL